MLTFESDGLAGGPVDGDPEVTVVCITYKHEDFIRETLDSFLAQKTTFRFQVFVGEDCGPDGTADIIREYAERHPGIIVPFLRETNMGAQRNLIDMCQRAGTKYIAFCEGDDFWTDDLKLQKQYDYMEAHPELSGCFHNTEIQSDEDWYLTSFYKPDPQGRRLIPFSIPRYDRSLTAMRIGYYIRFGPAHTSSMFFRWNYDLEIPDWYYGTVFGDHPIMAMQIGRGLLGFLPDVMSVYRRHAGGAIMNSSERSHHLETREDWLVVLEGLAQHFRGQYGSYAASDIRARMVTEMRNYLTHAVRSGDSADILRVIGRHPEAFEAMIGDYAATSGLRNRLITKLYGWDAAGVLPNALAQAMTVIPSGALKKRRRARKRNRIVDYARYAGRPKEPGLWLFMCDDKVSYRDGVRAFYEHVVAEHPEVRPYWLTQSADVEKMLRSEGLPVARLKTAASRSLLSKAQVLACASLRSDVFEMRGFNAGIRVVRVLDNRYFDNNEHLTTASALETIGPSDDGQDAIGSPQDWKSASNLVFTDSRMLARRLRSADEQVASRIVELATEARLLAIPEPLTPVRKHHLLFAPGSLPHVEADAFTGWLFENASALNETAGAHELVVHVHLPPAHRVDARVRDIISGYEHIRFLNAFDVYSHISRFAAAVCGVDPLAYGLVRAGVPVSLRVADDDPTADRVIRSHRLRDVLPGRVDSDWMRAFRSAVEQIGTRDALPPHHERIEAEFGVDLTLHADALEEMYKAVDGWLREGVRR